MPPISIAVIDEAHCISEWSHNFRSAYMRLNQVLRGSNDISLNAKCVLALTATATPPVVSHIAASLQLPTDGILVQSWKRSNLTLNVQKDVDRYQALFKLLKSNIFIKTKKATSKKSVHPDIMALKKLRPCILLLYMSFGSTMLTLLLKRYNSRDLVLGLIMLECHGVIAKRSSHHLFLAA